MSFLNTLDTMSYMHAYDKQVAATNPLNFTVATIADVGTSLWNSVTFGQAEVSTDGLLRTLGADGAATAYVENRDAIQLLSLVGGSLIPGFAALKLTKAVREGNKAFYAFSSAKRAEDAQRLSALVAEGKKGHAEYKKLRNASILKAQANGLADTMASEIAIMGAMNAHPLMEDYMADPVKNFGISMAIGSAFTVPFAAIGSRTMLRKAVADVEQRAITDVVKTAGLYDMPFADTSSILVSLDQAASNIETLAKLPTTNKFTADLATDMALSMRTRAAELTKSKIPLDLDAENARHLQRLMTTPEFLGVDRVSYFAPRKESVLAKVKGAILPRPSTPEFVVDETLTAKHFFSPEHGSFVPKEWSEQLATAADAYGVKDIRKRASQMTHQELRKSLDTGLMASHQVEAEYLARLAFYEGLGTSQLAHTTIVGSDLPAVHGWVKAVTSRRAALQERMAKLDPAAPDSLKDYGNILQELDEINLAKLTISDGDLVKTVKIEELAALPTNSTNSRSIHDQVRPTHFEEMERLFSVSRKKAIINGKEVDTLPPLISKGHSQLTGFKDIERFVIKHGFNTHDWGMSGTEFAARVNKKLADHAVVQELDTFFAKGASASDLSYEAKVALMVMVSANEPAKRIMRAGLESAHTLRKGQGSKIPWHDAWTEILNHPLAKQHRDALKANIAAANGKVVLKRGLKSDPSGQTSMASYTWDESVARSFATTKGTVVINQVHVDDIVGYLYHGEREILVASSTRKDLAGNITDYFDNVAKATGKPAPKGMPNKTEFSLDEAEEFLKTQTVESLRKSVNDGMPVEVAAIRHNMTADQAMASMSIMPTELPARWQSAAQIEEALSHERRIVEATARSVHHLEETGELLAKQRQALADGVPLQEEWRAAANSLDSLGAEQLRARLSVMDNLMGQVHKEWVDLTMGTSASMMARDLYSRVLSHSDLTLLQQGLGEVSNAIGGNSLWQSADFVTRNMTQIGRIVTNLGDARVQAVNQLVKNLGEPVSMGFRGLASSPARRTEFAMLDKFRQQTKGALYWDSAEGRFFTEYPAEGMPITSHVGPQATSTEVRTLMDNIVAFSDELKAMRQTHSRLSSAAMPTDLGVWIPSQNLMGKEFSYIQNLETHEIKLLVAESREELVDLTRAYKLQPNERIMTRSRAELENLSLLEDGRIEKVTMANVDRTKQGITGAAEDISSRRLEDIMKGYIAQTNKLATGLMEEAMHDVVQKLEYLSAINRRAWEETGKTGWNKAVAQLKHKDVAGDVKDYLLGKNPVHRHEFMRQINSVSNAVISWGAEQSMAAWQMVRPSRIGDPIDYKKYTDALEAAGIPNPFAAFEASNQAHIYALAKNAGYNKEPQRIVNAFNALASTTALKFAEIAQPIVNLLSLPILMSSSISRMTQGTNLDAGTFFESSQTAIMYSGLRRSMSKQPDNLRYFQMAVDEGLLSGIVSEADAAMRTARLHTDAGMLSKLERAVESDFVNLMSKPATWAEEQVRRIAFGTGVELAIRNYGNKVTDRQVLIFARDFLKQANGNYGAHQRPAMFQGTFGAAMGLFQTYMLTYAQNMYSHLEAKDFKGLAKLMLAQGGIFGTGSLPGFSPISEVIGQNFSDENYDLTTGLYRAMPDKVASTLVYGMPSNLLGALHTRGDVSPRIPSGFFEFVAPSVVGQYAETVINVAKGAARFDSTAGAAMLEALSLQSASRPIARLSELITGHATTKAGVVVAGTEEVWSAQGILSRILSTRTLAEAKAREAIHLNTVYGQADRENRQAVIKRLRQDLRHGQLSQARMDSYATEYLRTGSPQGWRSAVNEAVLNADTKGIIDLSDKLRDSPLSLMLDDMDL